MIEDYPYASDGLEIWDDIKSWVEEYVSFYYKSAEELQKDPELQAWWKELVEVGHGDLKISHGGKRYKLVKSWLKLLLPSYGLLQLFMLLLTLDSIHMEV